MQTVNQTNAVSSVIPSVSIKATRGVTEVKLLNRLNLRSTIEAQIDKFVSVDFFKRDGSLRTLTGRLGVTSYLKGGVNKVEADGLPYLTMFDVEQRQYRTVNLATVRALRANGLVYQITD